MRKPDAYTRRIAGVLLCCTMLPAIVPDVSAADVMGGAQGAERPWLDSRFGQMDRWLTNLVEQLRSPLFWFGMVAQGMFFMRFIWQWVVSEKRKRSTIPVVFWYFSLAGGICMFIYACLRADLVIMLGQLLGCVIYARNLMLIRNRTAIRKTAGLPADDAVRPIDDPKVPETETSTGRRAH
jgi:lipid-A-disaccharide synthase-like uncharacterized protein